MTAPHLPEPVNQLTEAQVDDLVGLYQSEWWTGGRERADVVRMLRYSDVVVGFSDENGRLVAFARALSDRVYKALILDVIVDPEHRGTGLGDELMRGLLDHPHLEAVRHFELYCLPEMLPFYQRFGFTDELGALRFARVEPRTVRAGV